MSNSALCLCILHTTRCRNTLLRLRQYAMAMSSWRSSTPAYALTNSPSRTRTSERTSDKFSVQQFTIRQHQSLRCARINQTSRTEGTSVAPFSHSTMERYLYTKRLMQGLSQTPPVITYFLMQLNKLTWSEAVSSSTPILDALQVLLDVLEVELDKQRASCLVATQVKHADKAPARHSVHQSHSCDGKYGVARKAVVALDQQAKEY